MVNWNTHVSFIVIQSNSIIPVPPPLFLLARAIPCSRRKGTQVSVHGFWWRPKIWRSVRLPIQWLMVLHLWQHTVNFYKAAPLPFPEIHPWTAQLKSVKARLMQKHLSLRLAHPGLPAIQPILEGKICKNTGGLWPPNLHLHIFSPFSSWPQASTPVSLKTFQSTTSQWQVRPRPHCVTT